MLKMSSNNTFKTSFIVRNTYGYVHGIFSKYNYAYDHKMRLALAKKIAKDNNKYSTEESNEESFRNELKNFTIIPITHIDITKPIYKIQKEHTRVNESLYISEGDDPTKYITNKLKHWKKMNNKYNNNVDNWLQICTIPVDQIDSDDSESDADSDSESESAVDEFVEIKSIQNKITENYKKENFDWYKEINRLIKFYSSKNIVFNISNIEEIFQYLTQYTEINNDETDEIIKKINVKLIENELIYVYGDEKSYIKLVKNKNKISYSESQYIKTINSNQYMNVVFNDTEFPVDNKTGEYIMNDTADSESESEDYKNDKLTKRKFKSNDNKPCHILIYGMVSNGQNAKNIFRSYSLPMYGSADDTVYIGYEYGRINGLYDEYKQINENGKICEFSVPQKIKDLFKILYPGETPKCYALIQNVYTSHYCYGSVVYGYPIIAKSGNKDDLYEILVEDCNSKDDDGMVIISSDGMGHNMKNLPSQYIYGKAKELVVCEDEDDCEELALQLTSTHIRPTLESRDVLLERLSDYSTDITLAAEPIFTIYQQMCYCCT